MRISYFPFLSIKILQSSGKFTNQIAPGLPHPVFHPQTRTDNDLRSCSHYAPLVPVLPPWMYRPAYVHLRRYAWQRRMIAPLTIPRPALQLPSNVH